MTREEMDKARKARPNPTLEGRGWDFNGGEKTRIRGGDSILYFWCKKRNQQRASQQALIFCVGNYCVWHNANVYCTMFARVGDHNPKLQFGVEVLICNVQRSAHIVFLLNGMCD